MPARLPLLAFRLSASAAHSSTTTVLPCREPAALHLLRPPPCTGIASAQPTAFVLIAAAPGVLWAVSCTVPLWPFPHRAPCALYFHFFSFEVARTALLSIVFTVLAVVCCPLMSNSEDYTRGTNEACRQQCAAGEALGWAVRGKHLHRVPLLLPARVRRAERSPRKGPLRERRKQITRSSSTGSDQLMRSSPTRRRTITSLGAAHKTVGFAPHCIPKHMAVWDAVPVCLPSLLPSPLPSCRRTVRPLFPFPSALDSEPSFAPLRHHHASCVCCGCAPPAARREGSRGAHCLSLLRFSPRMSLRTTQHPSLF